MRALELQAYDGQLHLVEKPTPRPGPGEVLIRIAAAPINPSDVAFIHGRYGVKKRLPVIPGIEGSGQVIQAGPGLMPRLLLRRRVACIAPDDGDGTWAEYMVADAATRCVPLFGSVTFEQGAMAVVNPWSAWALMTLARRGGHRAVVQTAAASELGRMLHRLAPRFSVTMVHVVRRPDQVELLRGLGAAEVLDSNAADFPARLKSVCRDLSVTLAFDAVAGEMTGHLLAALRRGGRVIVYGGLSGAPGAADPAPLIFEGKSIEGFWLVDWIRRLGRVGVLRLALSTQRLLGAELQSVVRARVSLEKVPEAIRAYTANMTGGKILIAPAGRERRRSIEELE